MDSTELLEQAYATMTDGAGRAIAEDPVWAGVDLGTAYTVVLAVDSLGCPIGGAMEFAQIVRDGLVVDFVGAVDLLCDLKARVEAQLGRALRDAYSAFPPGVPPAERRATANVVEAAGFECRGLIDEPAAANAVLGIREGAIVDVGGGTTGIAIVRDGKVVYTADEPTGGTHFSLVVAGALNLSFEDAEQTKTDPAEQPRLFPILRPVMEKVSAIVARHIAGHAVEQIHLVGGASAYPGFADVVSEWTGVPASVPPHPLYVTPLGIALSHRQSVASTPESIPMAA